MSLGSKIRELRIKKGLTQSDLGSGLVTPSMISQIESDKANPSYKVLEAIAEKLEQPIEYFLSDVEALMEQSTAFKVARALISSKSYERAIELLRKLDEFPSTHNLNEIDVKIELGRCQMELSQDDEASRVLLEVSDLALTKGEYNQAISALNMLGSLERRRKKPHNAIYYWRKGYDLFPQLQVAEPFLQSELLINLGSLHYDLGETQDALSHFHVAMNLLANTNNFEQIGMSYLGLAMSYRKTKEFELASEYANYATSLFVSINNMKMAIEAKRHFVTTEQNRIEFRKTLTILEDCLAQCNAYNFKDEAATIYKDMACLYLQQNQHELSLKAIEDGIAVAPVGSVTAASLLRVKGLAFGKLDKQEEAEQAIEQAIHIYESHNQNVDVADCYTLLAELHQQAGDVQTANKYLQQMRWVLQESLRERGLHFSA